MFIGSFCEDGIGAQITSVYKISSCSKPRMLMRNMTLTLLILTVRLMREVALDLKERRKRGGRWGLIVK